MMNLVEFSEQYRRRVENYLAEILPSQSVEPRRLHSAMRYSVLNPGKRLRPLLVYATGTIFDSNDSFLDATAGAVELIHAYSLIHDDLPCMDDDDLRRGLPTCHIKFDQATAVLAGDALQTLAFDILSTTNQAISATAQLTIINQLANASGSMGMGGGQAIDLAATGRELTIEQLETMHQKKTGALIEASVMMGYLASGHDDEKAKMALKRYSKSIGLAFQIVDDILDIESDTQTLGKPQGSDVAANKMTYPSILGLAGAKQHASNQLQQALAALDELPYNTQLLADFAHHIVERKH
ncbi:MAG: farnesyl diphosphate synthase [Kangiellaceae bacterium]|nr:farnesyl diphosphate synthase [Kangiellaceae bacterium]